MKKTAIVTGGTRGIGFAIASALDQAGYNIVISDLWETTDVLPSFANEALYVQADVTKKEDSAKLLAATIQRFGRVDVLVNNAGVAPKQRLDLLELSEESFDFVMDVNLKGAFFLSQMAAKEMIKQQNTDEMPRIIFISSISAYVSSTSRGEYCISKAAVSMVRSLFADRLAEEGIRVFEVRPGIIKTDMTAVVTEKYDKLIADGLTPIKRWGQPQDVAGVVAMLCRSEFDFCTGDVINVDGGYHIRRL